MMRELSAWIVTTPFSIYLQNLKGMVPTVQTAHIVAIAAVLSSSAMIDLRLLGLVNRDRTLKSISHRFQPGIWIGLLVLAITGGLLITAEPARSLMAGQFQIKMLLLVFGVSVTLLLQRGIHRHAAQWEEQAGVPAGTRVLAIVSLLIWMGMIMAGRWIAYA